MAAPDGYERPGIAGSGTIACGLAATASQVGQVKLLARSDASAWRAEEAAQAQARKVEGGAPDRIKVTTNPADLAECDLIVEAIAEEIEPKAELLRALSETAAAADLASTTSSLSIDELADRSGTPTRLFGLHVFSPVPRMELIELCFPPRLADGIAQRARAWCAALGKTAVDVPDIPGFVVNRLMFPALFEAVRLVESTHLNPADLDTCMKLGAGHPMGPLQLLDFVGLDVAAAIGDSLHADSGRESDRVPQRIREMIAAGKLGRKSGEGFYTY
ncbi:MAG TPA: 3-hydroxyacyl-CoA dehydrogenase family protein [Solirubrobacterales bacterium]|nr:3-hydroxyacyl-CoA dehydrogenase family protein [Solirubrobacterales bacterium]